MAITGKKAEGNTQNSYFKVKTFSVSEILSAGGATAFGAKMSKKTEGLVARLKDFPQDAFLTNNEAQSALDTLKSDK